MNIILLNSSSGKTSSLPLSRLNVFLLFVFLILLPLGLGVGGYFLSVWVSPPIVSSAIVQDWQDSLDEQKQGIRELANSSEGQLTALTVKMAQMQARLLRLDALGEHITELAKLNKGEFDFSDSPAVGGPEDFDLGEVYDRPDFLAALDELTKELEQKEDQLEVLGSLVANRKLKNDVFLAGRPVEWGWMSSRYGRRTDPFTGRLAWHKGVDFAGKEGSSIVAVAAGVVTWSGDRHGYGELVEINHGGGYVTRYGHNKEILVQVGDIVHKGHIISKMGSTGRSTGPHVHFEVFKNGRAQNPAKYIYRASR